MIGNRYKNQRDNVLDIHRRYVKRRGSDNDGLNQDHLRDEIDALENGKYTIAVAGEVKSGKSTFINALLGAEILPADVLQATSAIIEIFKAKQPMLKIVYGDGREENIDTDSFSSGLDAIQQKLKEICCQKDSERDIPAALLNRYILDGKQEINDSLLNEIKSKTKLDVFSHKGEIDAYIKNTKPKDIATEIHVGYPLKWDFDELRLVDSPGVNAVGGVQETTYRYIDTANAIMFVHPIKPVESASFREFFDSVISDRSKESLFIILTHAGICSDGDVDRLHAEARSKYEKQVPAERILVVDSLLKLIHQDISDGIQIEEIHRSSEQKSYELERFENIAHRTKRDIKEVLLEKSRFDILIQRIDEFSLKAPSIQLRGILNRIRQGYENLNGTYSDRITLLESRMRNPQEFAYEIARINQLLESYKHMINLTINEFEREYSGVHADFAIRLKDIKEKYSKLIVSAKKDDKIRKHATDAVNELDILTNEVNASMVNEMKARTSKIGKEFEEKHSINIQAMDHDSLASNAKKNAYRQENIYEDRTKISHERRFYTLWLYRHDVITKESVVVGSKEVYDDGEYLAKLSESTTSKFQEIADSVPHLIEKIRINYLGSFKNIVTVMIEGRQAELNAEKDKQRENEEILAEIEGVKGKKSFFPQDVHLLAEVLENLP